MTKGLAEVAGVLGGDVPSTDENVASDTNAPSDAFFDSFEEDLTLADSEEVFEISDLGSDDVAVALEHRDLLGFGLSNVRK
ncbi:MAG: hypothetical protein WBB82_06685 [Limnothrix sp.]